MRHCVQPLRVLSFRQLEQDYSQIVLLQNCRANGRIISNPVGPQGFYFKTFVFRFEFIFLSHNKARKELSF
jgi:hypothetical protein